MSATFPTRNGDSARQSETPSGGDGAGAGLLAYVFLQLVWCQVA